MLASLTLALQRRASPSSPTERGRVVVTPLVCSWVCVWCSSEICWWQPLLSSRQAARLREDIHNMGSLYMSEICTEMKNLRSLVRVCEIQATLREQRWGKDHSYTEIRMNPTRTSTSHTHAHSPPHFQNPVSEAAEQRVRQAEEPELVHGVRSWPGRTGLGWMDENCDQVK